MNLKHLFVARARKGKYKGTMKLPWGALGGD